MVSSLIQQNGPQPPYSTPTHLLLLRRHPFGRASYAIQIVNSTQLNDLEYDLPSILKVTWFHPKPITGSAIAVAPRPPQPCFRLNGRSGSRNGRLSTLQATHHPFETGASSFESKCLPSGESDPENDHVERYLGVQTSTAERYP
jgi:hypothetical protein